jgi:prepilin-type N-terminal cleavage/methylation domain-containing protein
MSSKHNIIRHPSETKSRFVSGFTLIELIVAIVIVSFLATMLVSFIGTSVTRSSEPVIMVQHGSYLNSIMENMTADFKYLMATDNSPMTTFISLVGSVGSSQTHYSKDGHPYTIVESKRISFPTGSPVTEQDDGNGRVLKITIAYHGLTLTSLFSE